MADKSRWNWRWTLAIAAMAALAVGAALAPVQDWADAFEDWLEQAGTVTAMVCFAGVYFVASLLFVPAWIFPLGAGALFGWLGGLAISMATGLAAAITAFLGARYLMRGRLAALMRKHPRFHEVERAIASEGWKVVALLRLSPVVPSALKNYLFGATRLTLRDYVAGSLAGMLPGMMLKVYVGSLGRSAWSAKENPIAWALFAGGLAASFAVTWLIGRRARARLGLD